MAELNEFLNTIVTPTSVTIALGDTESGAIDCFSTIIKTIILPASFEGTEVSFKISADGVNYFPYYNIDNLPVAFTCSPSRAYGLGAIDFYSVRYVKLVSNVAVTADRVITLITKPL
jgi:hypothetical protein